MILSNEDHEIALGQFFMKWPGMGQMPDFCIFMSRRCLMAKRTLTSIMDNQVFDVTYLPILIDIIIESDRDSSDAFAPTIDLIVM